MITKSKLAGFSPDMCKNYDHGSVSSAFRRDIHQAVFFSCDRLTEGTGETADCAPPCLHTLISVHISGGGLVVCFINNINSLFELNYLEFKRYVASKNFKILQKIVPYFFLFLFVQ